MFKSLVIALAASLTMVFTVVAAHGGSTPQYLYKVISVEAWDNSWTTSSVQLSEMDSKFIHLAAEDQLDRIIAKYWRDASSYIVLKLNSSKLKGRLVYEANPGGINRYYHLYHGSIPMDAVIDVKRVDRPLPKSGSQENLETVSQCLHAVVEGMNVEMMGQFFARDLRFVSNQKTVTFDELKEHLIASFNDLKMIEVRQPFTEAVSHGDKVAVAYTLVLTSKRGIRREVQAMTIATIKRGKIQQVTQLTYPE